MQSFCIGLAQQHKYAVSVSEGQVENTSDNWECGTDKAGEGDSGGMGFNGEVGGKGAEGTGRRDGMVVQGGSHGPKFMLDRLLPVGVAGGFIMGAQPFQFAKSFADGKSVAPSLALTELFNATESGQ